jgi:hypothetical protein
MPKLHSVIKVFNLVHKIQDLKHIVFEIGHVLILNQGSIPNHTNIDINIRTEL